MRLLVRCSRCQRQYDAGRMKPGARFRCRCGAVLEVKKPQGHEASVVRCSSCGGPREEGSLNCQFCGADFTLHDRDLNTVCPGCLSRVSDRARFCHHCGLELAPEAVAAESSKLICPACEGTRRLHDRPIGDVHVMECDRCAGLWLGNDTFRQLTQRASSDSTEIDRFFETRQQRFARPPQVDAPAGESADSWRYRKCPSCGIRMYRRNYARKSGVVIDVCKHHGIWFDADELPRILAWIHEGGLAKAKEEEAKKAAREERTREARKRIDRELVMNSRGEAPSAYGRGDPLAEFVQDVAFWFFRP